MSDQLISLAIDNISKTDFETWAQKVLATTEGIDFAPTGGIHDGGQDGFIRGVEGQPAHYIQITKQEDTRKKVRETIEAIRKKRKLDQLTFVTSEVEQNRDLLEAKWGKEFSLRLRIHDRSWLLVRASLDESLRDELYGYVRGLLEELNRATSVRRQIGKQDRLSIVTYLEAQAKSLPKAEDFQNICLDTVIYAALQGTDPAEEKFKTGDELKSELEVSHGQLLAKAPVNLEDRLEFLSSKNNSPRLRKHPGEKFALPYEVRSQFGEFNISIQNQEDTFLASLSSRIREQAPGLSNEMHGKVLTLVRDTLHETFRRQAMNFANSFNASTEEVSIEVFEIIAELSKEMEFEPQELEAAHELAASVFRGACYSSEQGERAFIETLMKYYTVHFLMHGDAVVSEYFSEMSKRLRVYLGTDIIVRCLSETFVKERSRGMTNALSRIRRGGVTLRITRRTLEEVFSHLHTTYLTFRNDFEGWYRNGSLQDIMQSDKILIRAFGYAYFEPIGHTRQPRDWSDFLNQFGSASWFAEPERNIDEFGSYLIEKYGFEFVELEGVTSKIDTDLAQEIADGILDARDRGTTSGHAKLALNDAQMALLITAERNERGERVTTDLYGYNTWWMTEEAKVLRELRKRDLSANIVMHPQFLINHLLLDQAALSENHQGQDLTPTLFGLRITNRVPSASLKQFLDAVRDMGDLGEAAQRARIRAAANRLKSEGRRAT
ncbi:hypothetical protein D1820_01895 [Phaeobacter sp. LSS9]|uniref:restriction endonuclease n=1 Tax=unclassified Phaeobacter TaxID=2621772 RepID=UPI000E4FB89B|nr:restriction endonuclease [Phaeobacter sp. LSS9]AXT33821.1 hypothetical protein D1820_01895 [Phaeobacter sp. LSS9]